MLKLIKKIKNESDFKPNLISFIFNPFYIVRKDLYNHIKKLAPDVSGNILDVGCGSKPYQDLFINKISYVGLEYESPILTEKKISVEYTYKGDEFPFENERFDSLVCFQVLEHVFTPDFFVKELNRILKNDGVLLLTVPFVWDEHEQPFDFGRYTSFGLKALFEKNGFQILEHKKSTNGFRGVLQLVSLTLFKSLPKVKFVKYTVLPVFLIFINSLSLLIKEKDNDLYMDNIILLRKVN